MTALKAPCEHGRYEAHTTKDGEYVVLIPDKWGQLLQGPGLYEPCPGGVVLPPDSIVIVKEEGGRWPTWAIRTLYSIRDPQSSFPIATLDALAAAQVPRDNLWPQKYADSR